MNRFAGTAPVFDDREGAYYNPHGDGGECCHCGDFTRKLWYRSGDMRRIAHACSFAHLEQVYPHYNTDTTDWE